MFTHIRDSLSNFITNIFTLMEYNMHPFHHFQIIYSDTFQVIKVLWKC